MAYSIIDMLSEYISKQMSKARYKLLRDGSYFGEIPRLKGVWANANTLEDCRTELQEVLEDWLVIKVRSGDLVPGFKLPTLHRERLAHA